MKEGFESLVLAAWSLLLLWRGVTFEADKLVSMRRTGGEMGPSGEINTSSQLIHPRAHGRMVQWQAEKFEA